MMHGKRSNNLIVIENGLLTSYQLDDKNVWELGRPSRNNIPDIKLHSATVSRRHGRMQNMDGVWFYMDYNSKNGTVYNDRRIQQGRNGKVKPVMLSDGDQFVFGGGETAVINCKTIWAMFVTKDFDDRWRVADAKGLTTLRLADGGDTTILENPDKGTVVEKDTGIAIYMGDLIYMIGDMELAGN